MGPHAPILSHHAPVDGSSAPRWSKYPWIIRRNNSLPGGLHYSLQFTVGYPLGCLMREPTEQLFKVRWGSV